MKTSKKIILALFLIALALAYYLIISSRSPGQYDDFAKCLTEKGFEMYGAYWCQHCKDQKLLFGKSFNYINYTECTQKAEECNKASINKYPTWIFPDGNKYEGVLPLEQLSSLSGCELKKDE